jgi:hypothetical protein
MNLKKIAAVVAILGAIGFATAPVVEAKPHGGDWCHGCGGHGGDWNGGWGGWGGWVPNVNACVAAQGPYGNVAGYVCI